MTFFIKAINENEFLCKVGNRNFRVFAKNRDRAYKGVKDFLQREKVLTFKRKRNIGKKTQETFEEFTKRVSACEDYDEAKNIRDKEMENKKMTKENDKKISDEDIKKKPNRYAETYEEYLQKVYKYCKEDAMKKNVPLEKFEKVFKKVKEEGRIRKNYEKDCPCWCFLSYKGEGGHMPFEEFLQMTYDECIPWTDEEIKNDPETQSFVEDFNKVFKENIDNGSFRKEYEKELFPDTMALCLMA